jgi:hypothetical protein
MFTKSIYGNRLIQTMFGYFETMKFNIDEVVHKTQKAKKMRNTDPTNNLGVNLSALSE